MKNNALAIALTMLLLAPTLALAQNAPPAGGPPDGMMQDGSKFAEHKAEMLRRIDAHRACVAAATDHKALRACMPEHGPGGMGGGQGGPGGGMMGGGNGGPPGGGQMNGPGSEMGGNHP